MQKRSDKIYCCPTCAEFDRYVRRLESVIEYVYNDACNECEQMKERPGGISLRTVLRFVDLATDALTEPATRTALEVLADAGCVPPLRLVTPVQGPETQAV